MDETTPVGTTPADDTSAAAAPADPGNGDDPYLWLEEVSGEPALSWVRERNDETLSVLARGERFEQVRGEAREVLDSDERIPYVHRRGDHLY
ncbi:MAG: hypothetical protein ACRDP8_17680, partial [Actinopolymorphaceae bacterium]